MDLPKNPTGDQVTQHVQDALDERENFNQFNVSPIPFHTHNGTDSSQIDFNNLINKPTVTWKKQQAFSVSGVNLDQNFTTLPAHDKWWLSFSLTGGGNNNSLAVKINNIGGTSYNHMIYSTSDTLGTSSGAANIMLYGFGGAEYISGDIYIDGRVRSSTIGYNGQMGARLGRTRIAGPGVVTASGDTNQIEFLEINGGGGLTSFTGIGVLYYLDLS